MLDFRELSTDGTEFEMLVREVLFARGLDTSWSGVGPDGGKDLICTERVDSIFGPSTRRWLIQCKHFAHSGRSVGGGDIDNIRDSCSQHGADGYVIATSTYLSSGVVNRLEGIAADASARLLTSYLDGPMIERALLRPELFHVAQRFFPVSAATHQWNVSRTDRPNHFIVNYRGYLFHLTNRIGSRSDFHFSTIKKRIDDIESIKHPQGHFIRPRAFWYDDKNGGYSIHLDYMVPHDSKEARYSENAIANALGNGDVLEDGQFYTFDVVTRRYYATSDHHDVDHYRYYVPYVGSFLIGEGRDRSTIPSGDTGIVFSSLDEEGDDIIMDGDEVVDAGHTRAFEEFRAAVAGVLGLDSLRITNACPEALSLVSGGNLRKAWDRYGTTWNFNEASFIVSSVHREKVFRLIEMLDQGPEIMVSCREGWTFVPDDDGHAVRSFDPVNERLLFVKFSAPFADSIDEIRNVFNQYFANMAARLNDRRN